MLITADFHHPKGARIGLFTAMQNIGAMCAMPFGGIHENALHREDR